MSSPVASAEVAIPAKKRWSLVAQVFVWALLGLLITAYIGWQTFNRPVDPFDRLQRQIASMDPQTREEARALCAKFADQMYASADFKVNTNRCALVEEEGMLRLYGEATDPLKQRRIYWVILRRADDESEWEIAACGVEH